MVIKKPESWGWKLTSVLLIAIVIFLPLGISNSLAIPKGESAREDGFCKRDTDCLDDEYFCFVKKDGLINDACCPFGTTWNFYTKQCEGMCIDKDKDGFGAYGDSTCTFLEIDCDDNNTQINPDAEEICFNDIDENCNGPYDDICSDGDFNFTDFNFTDGDYEPVCLKDRCMNGDNDCDGIPDIGCANNECLEPRDEICNNKDDDCDGVIDDGCTSYCNKCGDSHWYYLWLDNPCDAEECASLGDGCEFNKGRCTEIIKPPPKNCIPEVCNGIDDDCDKLVDEECYPEEAPADIIDTLNFMLLMEKFHDKECKTTDDCGGMLACIKGTPNKCCFPEENNIAGSCKDNRRAEKISCDFNEQCQSEYCSKGVEGFWQGLTSPGKDAVKTLAKSTTIMAGPQYDDVLDEEIDKAFSYGRCCEKGTDYDTATDSCIEGGTFSFEGSTEFCKEKKLKGYSCEDGQGNCEYDDECNGGSYCTVTRFGENKCCPKGTAWNGDKCAETQASDCNSCGSRWFDSCDEDECFSIDVKCEFNNEHKSCYEKLSLRHEEGDCNAEGSKGCSAPNEELHCSVSNDYGVCCYPWEQQNPNSKRCEIVCEDEFCDIDGDLYNSEIEIKYGSHPLEKEDTPDVRIHVEECHTPFEHQRYAFLHGGVKRFVLFLISSVSMGLGNSIVSSLGSFFTEFSIEKPKVIWKGKFSGIASGVAYGVLDDLKFAAQIVTAPSAIIKFVGDLGTKKEEVTSKNPEVEQNLAEQYADHEIDSSIRNDMFGRASQLSYESYDYHFKQDLYEEAFKTFFGVDENCEDRQECLKQIYTKSFTTGFFGGYIWEQILLLGKIGGFLAKAGAKSGSTVLKIAGKTLKFADDPLKYGVIAPIKTLKSSIKLFSNFGEEGIQQIFKHADEGATLTALEMANIFSKNKKMWGSLTVSKFKNALTNFINVKKVMREALGDEAGVKAANALLETSVGKKIMIEGIGEAGWNPKTAKMLAEAISEHGSKKIDELFGTMNSAQLKKFGDELSQLASKDGEDAVRQMFKSFDELSNFIKGVDTIGTGLTGKQVADLFKSGASKDEIINALKKVKGVEQGVAIDAALIQQVPLRNFFGHVNDDVASILSRASHQHQLDPIQAVQFGNKYIIDDGVGRTTRAFWKGEDMVDIVVTRSYKSIDDLPAGDLDYLKRAVRIDSKQTMDLLEGASKSADDVVETGGKAADDVVKSAKKTGEEIIEEEEEEIVEFFGKEWNKKIKTLRTGPSRTNVKVNSIKEADALLKEAFPDAVKVKGAGPGSKVDWSEFKGKGTTKYHKDYQIEETTGLIYGHTPGSKHAENMHINIRREDGNIVNIVIE